MADKPAVLVTRPAGQAEALCAGLEGLGFRAYSQPMLELVGLATLPGAQRQHIDKLDGYRHIIFVSGNAVHFGMIWMRPRWPVLPSGPAWYAIGEATASRLLGAGVPAVRSGVGMTTEGLLLDPGLQNIAGDRVLIVRGRGGRVSLREELVARGAEVDELSCYSRRAPTMAPGELAGKLARWRPGLILISSGEGLENMLTLLHPQESSKLVIVPLVVPSARIAAVARDSGFVQVHTAANASDAAMLQAVQSWWQTYANVSGTGE